MGRYFSGHSRQVTPIKCRAENTVKNKYFSIVRRGVRVLNQAIKKHFKKYREIEMGAVREIVDSFDPTLAKEEMTAE